MPTGLPRAAASMPPSQLGPARVLLRGIAPTARPRQSWVQKQRKVLVLDQRAQRCCDTFNLNGKIEKLTQRAPFITSLFSCSPHSASPQKCRLCQLSSLSWSIPARPVGQGGCPPRAISEPLQPGTPLQPPLERRPRVPWFPSLLSPSFISVDRPLSDRIWLLVSHGAASSRQVGTDVGHCLLWPELPGLPGP